VFGKQVAAGAMGMIYHIMPGCITVGVMGCFRGSFWLGRLLTQRRPEALAFAAVISTDKVGQALVIAEATFGKLLTLPHRTEGEKAIRLSNGAAKKLTDFLRKSLSNPRFQIARA
jgi:hypothetical protein